MGSRLKFAQSSAPGRYFRGRGLAQSSVADRILAREPCPATGLWNCRDDIEGYEVLGGARQHFRKSARMPQADLLGPTALWSKLKGQQHTFQLSTLTRWTFVKEQP